MSIYIISRKITKPNKLNQKSAESVIRELIKQSNRKVFWINFLKMLQCYSLLPIVKIM